MGEETGVEQPGVVHESSSSKAQPSSSDALIADLLNDVKSSNKPFTTDDVANAVKGEKKHKKEHKQHKKKSKKEKKEKKSKKEKKRHRSRSRERSHSRKHKKKERKRSRSNSSTPSWESLERNGNIKKVHVDDAPPAENKPRATSPEGSEDSLPVGADYLAVYNETVADANAANCKGDAPLDLAKLPVQAPLQPSKASFPLSKNTNTKESGWVEVPESDILKKVMETKGKPDMVPRNLKIVQDKPRSNVDSGSGFDAKKTVVAASATSAAAVAETKKIIMNIKSAPPAEPLVMKKEGDVKEAFGPEKPDKKESKKRRRLRSLSSEERHRGNRRRSPAREWRERDRRSPDRRRSRSRERERRRSRSRDRRRSRSRDHRRSRSRDRRRSRSRDRRRSRSRSRRRSPGIDKQKLREIAEHNRKFGYIPGVGADGKPTKTIGEMIAHCARLQRREEKENKRAKGQVVSSDSEMSDYEAREPSHLPPAVANTIPVITFNIAKATNLPTRTPQERLLESGQLRVCYPVSSGLTHRDKTDEWTPVQKAEPVPSVCTNAQKRLVATSSKDKEKAKAEGRSVPDYVLPILPPPPIPPDLYGGGVPLGAAYISLPPPPPPPRMEGEPSYNAQPPPDSLTPLVITPDASHLIMKEPEAFQESVDMSTVMQRRAEAAKRLLADPNDYKARKEINRADEQMRGWASSHHLPGAFTGHNGVRILSQEELGPHDPRYNAWVKKDQFKSMRPVQSAVGRRLMEKMGWKPGEGLGKWGVGAIEPLSLEVKSDRKGLAGEGDAKKKNPTQVPAPGPVDVHGKNPVSLLMEYCAKKRWNAPQYVCEETGPPNNRLFMWKVSINGIVYHPSAPSCVKKTGKAVASHVALQALGLAPRSDVGKK